MDKHPCSRPGGHEWDSRSAGLIHGFQCTECKLVVVVDGRRIGPFSSEPGATYMMGNWIQTSPRPGESALEARDRVAVTDPELGSVESVILS